MHLTENEMWSNLFLNVRWLQSQGQVPQLALSFNTLVTKFYVDFFFWGGGVTCSAASSGGPALSHNASRCVGGN